MVNINKNLPIPEGDSYEASITTLNDGFILLEHVKAYRKGGFLYVNKLNENGDFLWQKIYRLTDSFGENIYSEGIVLKVYNYGDYGQFIGVLGNKTNESDCVIFKFDKNGDLIWVKSFNLDFDKEKKRGWIKDIKPTENGFIGYGYRYIIKNGKLKANTFVLKFNQDGEPEWLKEYELIEVQGDVRNSIVPKSISSYANGYYIVTELREKDFYSPGTVMVLNLDNEGNLKWSKVLRYDPYSFRTVIFSDVTDKNDLIVLAKIDEWNERDRRYTIKGTKKIAWNFGVYTAYVFKLSQSGELQWSNRITTKGLILLNPSVIKSIGDATILGGTIESEKGKQYIGLFKLNNESGNLEWQRVYKGKSGYFYLHSIDKVCDDFVAIASVGTYRWVFSFNYKGVLPNHQRKNIEFEVKNDLIDRPQEIKDQSNIFNLTVKNRDLNILKITKGDALELKQLQPENIIQPCL